VDAFSRALFGAAAGSGATAVFFSGTSPMMDAVACVAGDAVAGAAGVVLAAAGATAADAGTGRAFWRVAKYPPPAAAAMHASANPANASRFESMSISQ
jgi:hypothetical protein